MNYIINDFIFNCDKALIGHYRISPFTTKDIMINKNLPYSNKIDDYFRIRFGNYNYCYTENGRTAIRIALESLNLNKDDIVTIITTSNNHYISGCVTSEIEKICKWSRKVEKNSKVILVNHEFGFPYEKLTNLKKYNLPIIEDCAHTFLSQNKENSVGKIGDFIIYSFPKFFPIQVGGLLVYNHKYNLEYEIDDSLSIYIKKVLSFYIDNIYEWADKRIENYNYLNMIFQEIGMSTRFELTKNAIPGVFMFKIPINFQENHLKKFLLECGIQNSAFYKEKALFIPVHNKLCKDDLMYFFNVVKYYNDIMIGGNVGENSFIG